MSILDDAIREHLELKRAHGADEAELKRLEDEAFGPPGRPEEPDPFAEAPTEFMTTPEVPGDAEPAEESGRRINIADLQEPPPPERTGEREEPQVEATDAIEPEAEVAPLAPAEDAAQAAPPAEEELPPADEPQAMEHEVVVEPAEDAPATAAAEPGPGAETEERHAIAEQPTELFDIEAEMGTEDAPAVEPAEIQASRTETPPPSLPEEDEEDEEFWSEQRLSDELDQALESPLTDEHEVAPRTDVHEIPAPVADPTAPAPVHEDADEDDEAPRPDYDPDTGHEDVLEDTPDFLEDAPEDDELWFEQKPPKDFDLD
jgi:hypothetical protein